MAYWSLPTDCTMQYPESCPRLPPSTLVMLSRGEPTPVESKNHHAGCRNRNPCSLLSIFLCTLLFTFLLVGLTAGIYIRASNDPGNYALRKSSTTCRKPELRREWRSLNRAEKIDYIQSVKCLKTLPSRLQLNQTLYDDFPWIHKHFGEYAHDAAPFLAWHRYFIHIYELSLREQCNYQGHLTYWDWTLDWENVTLSPVWDINTGFGGTGDVRHGPPVFKAYCVTEGPFAKLEVLYFEDVHKPHCLLRGFDENLEEFRQDLNPESLMTLLLSPDYQSINLGLEHGPHLAIPKSVNGDFSLHTAPFGNLSSHSIKMRT